ncbi:MAG TPA: DUF3043 domain-containing protein [Mycobacterium sp.]|nr:DUF3043 domain-containing protein [Mycobacterium sp.]
MKLSGRRKDAGAPNGTGGADDTVDPGTGESAGDGQEPDSSRSQTTAPKGRPTPKRSAANRRRGPVAPAPMTSAEARARRKALAGPKLSREERQAVKAKRRERMAEHRNAVMAGDEKSLPARDQGQVRRFARDVVDARYNVLGLFLPSAVLLLFMTMAGPQLQVYVSLTMMILMAAMVVDALVLGRKVNKLADAKFPDNTESRLKLGLYAASRASQLRRMRVPRPQVNRGERVS